MPVREWVNSPKKAFFTGAITSLIVSSILVVGIILIWLAYFWYLNRILPGVSVGDTRLDGMTVEQAYQAINENDNLRGRITVDDGLHSYEISPGQLGLSIDPYLATQRAFAVGRSNNILADLDTLLIGLTEGISLEPAIRFDPLVANNGIEHLARETYHPPKNASIRIEGQRVAPIPGQPGYSLNVNASLDSLSNNFQAIWKEKKLLIQLNPILPDFPDASALAEEAQSIIDFPYTLQAYDPINNELFEWEIPPQLIASWLLIVESEPLPALSIDTSRVEQFLNTINQELGDSRWLDIYESATFLARRIPRHESYIAFVKHASSSYTVQSGDTLLEIGWRFGMPYWMIAQANPEVDPEKLISGEEIIIPSPDDLLPIPVIPEKRIIISITKQRLWAFENGEQVAKFIISTGMDRSPTQPGVFQIQTHVDNAYASVWDLTMPNFLGIYEAWPGFMNGIHGLPILSNGKRLWANVLGKPASYGCIILDMDDSDWLYTWAEKGVVVEIQP